MVTKFFRHVVALGLATFIIVGGLSGSKAYGDIVSGNFTISLQDLMDSSGTILQVGDKLFSNFDASSYAFGLGATPVPLSSIMLSPLTETGPLGHTEYGLQFAIVFGNTVYGGQGKDIVLEFDVTTTFGDNRIVDDYLSFSGGAEGGGHINISETVTDENGADVPAIPDGNASLYVFQDSKQVKLTDIALFAPQDWIHINKDINWYAENTCPPTSAPCYDRAFISHFEQLFSQQPPRDIPEPTSMILLGLGLAGLGVARRKRVAK